MNTSIPRPAQPAARGIITAAIALAFASAAWAHPPIEDAVAAIDPEALRGHAAAAAFLERAELRRLEHQWDLAEADYARAERIEPGNPAVSLGRAGVLFDRGRSLECEVQLDAMIGRGAEVDRAYELRARARAATGRFREAADDYDRWIAARAAPTPDDYVRRARWLEAADGHEDALRGIDEGLARLGPIAGLLIEASELEARLGRFTESSARLVTLNGEVARVRTASQRPLPASNALGAPTGIDSQRAPLPPGPPVGAPYPTLARGPYLQSGGPDRITIRWRTDGATDTRIQYARSGELPRSLLAPSVVTEHEVTVTGLAPGTPYTYSVEASYLSGIEVLATSTFTTAPSPGSAAPTRIWVIGDSGVVGADAVAVRDGFLAWNGTHPIDVWLMLGDNAYPNGDDAGYQAAVFDMFHAMLAGHVLWSTRGNHDVVYAPAPDYYGIFTLPTAGECGGLPSGSEAYYSFEYGAIHFICLDSEGSDRSRSGPMMRWLESDLAASIRPWTIAFWHHPPYSHGSHNSDDPFDSEGRMTDMRQVALGVLDSAGVDLVLAGHSHSYERSFLLRGHYGLSTTLTPAMKLGPGDGRVDGNGAYEKVGAAHTPMDGAVYAVAGSGSSVHFGAMDHPAMVSSLLQLGSIAIDVNALRLDARFLNEHGVALDSFTILKGTTLGMTGRPSAAPALSIRSISPNPMRASSTFGFTLPRAGHARLRIVDLAGRHMRLLDDAHESAGVHSVRWDGRGDFGARVAPGVYFAELAAGGKRACARFAVLE